MYVFTLKRDLALALQEAEGNISRDDVSSKQIQVIASVSSIFVNHICVDIPYLKRWYMRHAFRSVCRPLRTLNLNLQLPPHIVHGNEELNALGNKFFRNLAQIM